MTFVRLLYWLTRCRFPIFVAWLHFLVGFAVFALTFVGCYSCSSSSFCAVASRYHFWGGSLKLCRVAVLSGRLCGLCLTRCRVMPLLFSLSGELLHQSGFGRRAGVGDLYSWAQLYLYTVPIFIVLVSPLPGLSLEWNIRVMRSCNVLVVRRCSSLGAVVYSVCHFLPHSLVCVLSVLLFLTHSVSCCSFPYN